MANKLLRKLFFSLCGILSNNFEMWFLIDNFVEKNLKFFYYLSINCCAHKIWIALLLTKIIKGTPYITQQY